MDGGVESKNKLFGTDIHTDIMRDDDDDSEVRRVVVRQPSGGVQSSLTEDTFSEYLDGYEPTTP